MVLGGAAALLAIGVLIGWTIRYPVDTGPSPGPAGSGIAQASETPATPRPTAMPLSLLSEGLSAGARRSLTVDGVSLSFAVPAPNWVRYASLYISKSTDKPHGAEAMIFWARFPDGDFAHACGSVGRRESSTAADLAAHLATAVPGAELISGPTEGSVGGLPAQQVVLLVRDARYCGPGLFYDWAGEDQRGGPLWGAPEPGDTISVWIVDIQGAPFVIGGETHFSAEPGLVDELQQIVASVQFEPAPPPTPPYENSTDGGLLHGRQLLTVDGTPISFDIQANGWEHYGSLLLSKSFVGPQGAEAVIYWARYPDGADADPCGDLANRPVLGSAADVAQVVATAPGTELVIGPEDVTVGGYPAKHVVLTVHDDYGCDPGFFYNWKAQTGGAMWTETRLDDTIRVWVVDVNGIILFIGGETTTDSHVSTLTDGDMVRADQQIQQIIDSIRFE